MKKQRRSFNKPFKLKVLKEASIKGIRNTCDKYGIYATTYYSWKRKFEDMGEQGFSHGMTKARLQKIKELEQEVELLKQLLGEERMAGKLKDDLLKKACLPLAGNTPGREKNTHRLLHRSGDD